MIAHLYFDLMQDENDNLTNKQNRFICYRWWVRIRYGDLEAGRRKKVHPCIHTEIYATFPVADWDKPVGFREAPGRTAD